MNICLVLSVLFGFVPTALAYPGGAAPSACVSMRPDHGSQPSTETSPFAVTLSSTSYTPGSTIKVTLKSICDTKFYGFLIQARRADTSAVRTVPIGSFTTIAGTKQLCTGGLTHSSSVANDMLELTWTAPSPVEGHVVFKVTFVTVPRTIYWEQVTSVAVNDGSSLALNIHPDSVQTPVLDSASCPAPAAPPTKDRFSPNSECGSTRGCYSDCDGTSCSFEVTWQMKTPTIDFTIKASTKQTGIFYAAIGFSEDNKMGSDSVIECVHSSGTVSVFNSFNPGRSNDRNTANPQTGLTAIAGKYESNIFECSFTRQITISGDNKLYDLSNQYYMFFAQGIATAQEITKHDSTPTSSPSAIDFSKNLNFAAVSPSKSLVQAHGSLMVIGWIMTASIGLVVARYFKPIWPNHSFMGQKIWFQIHRVCMISTFTATILAFIIIFVDVKGWAESPISVQNAHPFLGVIVTILTIVNPIMAVFRPHPGTDNRWIFNWAHWGVGTAAYIFGGITVAIGTRMDRAAISEDAVWVVVGFIVWQLVVVLSLELIQILASKEKSDTYELQGGPQVQENDTKPKPPGGTLKIAVLLVHVVVVVAFTIALIVFIAM